MQLNAKLHGFIHIKKKKKGKGKGKGKKDHPRGIEYPILFFLIVLVNEQVFICTIVITSGIPLSLSLLVPPTLKHPFFVTHIRLWAALFFSFVISNTRGIALSSPSPGA